MRAARRIPSEIGKNIYVAFPPLPGKESPGKIEISLLCPTRNRPYEMTRMWHSAIQTAQKPESIEVIFYLDYDDKMGFAGLRQAAARHPSQIRAISGERIILSQCWNAAAEIAKGDIFMHCGDDIIFRSKGWDEMVCNKMNSLPDRIAFVYGDDLIMGEKLGTHGFISREWVKSVGYFVPPIFSSDYNDTWLNEVADKIGRKFYVPEIVTEHMHFAAKKSHIDATHRERLQRHQEDDVDDLWVKTAHLREQDAQKLLASIEKEKQP